MSLPLARGGSLFFPRNFVDFDCVCGTIEVSNVYISGALLD